MGKTVLSLEPDYDFFLLGISCHVKDYRLCWEINRQLELNLRREPDHEVISGKKTVTKTSFSQYTWDDEERMISFTLFANRSQGGMLVPELKQADFLFVVKGNAGRAELTEIKEKIQALEVVLATFEIPVGSLKSKANLVF